MLFVIVCSKILHTITYYRHTTEAPPVAITRETIFQAADTLVEQGQDPTLAAVRAALGGGSYTTISETMKAWRAERDALSQARAVPPPQAAQDRAAQLVGEVWQLAQAAAESRLESERQALAAVRAELEAQAREAAELADQMETQLEQARTDHAAVVAQAEQDRADRDATRRARDEAERQAAQLTARLEALAQERDAARQEAKEALAQAARLQGQLQAEQDRRQQAEAQARQVKAFSGIF